MIPSRVVVGVLALALLFYSALLGWKGVLLLGTGSTVGVLLGLAVLVVPVLGVLLIGREIQFGRRCARLARLLDSEGGLPPDDLARRPSGRIDREAARAHFAAARADAEAEPDSWQAWFRLALAYDAAGDRARARAAARHALTLHG